MAEEEKKKTKEEEKTTEDTEHEFDPDSEMCGACGGCGERVGLFCFDIAMC